MRTPIIALLVFASFAQAAEDPLKKEIQDLVLSRKKAEAEAQVKINSIYLDKLKGIQKKAESAKQFELVISLKKEVSFVEQDNEHLQKIKDLKEGFEPKLEGVKFTNPVANSWLMVEKDTIQADWNHGAPYKYKRNGNLLVASEYTWVISTDGSYIYYQNAGDVEKSRFYRLGKIPKTNKKADVPEAMNEEENTLFGRRVRQ